MTVFLIIFCFQSVYSADCVDMYQSKDHIQVQQLKTIDGHCLISVVPKNAYVDLVYRSYVFSSQGSLLVFNSFGEGNNENELTGAKEFYFFPRLDKSQSFSWVKIANKDYLDLQTNHQFNVLIDARTGLIDSVANANVKIDPEIKPNNQGGVRIKPQAGLIYELPFTKGYAPSSRPRIQGVFWDAFGEACVVKVSELFNKDSNGESYFKMNDNALKQFLKIKCPKIDVGFL